MSPHRRRRFSDTYADAAAKLRTFEGGPCPIEAGMLLSLADHECEHGKLPGDRVPCPICHGGVA